MSKKSRVAAQISHDMRIPLTALTTSLEMLRESVPPGVDELRDRLYATARRSADRISHMIDGLLRLSACGRQAVEDVDGVRQEGAGDGGGEPFARQVAGRAQADQQRTGRRRQVHRRTAAADEHGLADLLGQQPELQTRRQASIEARVEERCGAVERGAGRVAHDHGTRHMLE